jgi:polysaccharide export outer membrane protein
VAVGALIDAAGGLTAAADASAIEILRGGGGIEAASLPAAAAVLLRPGDALRVPRAPRALEAQAVVVEGEVVRPGAYDVRPGDRLSDLLARAGGLTELAYPAGAVFTRASVRAREAESFAARARELEQQLASALLRERPPSGEQADLVRALAAELRGARPPGRLTVEADPEALALRPELDPLLEPGDRLTVPRRPLTVAVAGEVHNPGHRQFRSGRTADDYLAEAGGPTRAGDRDLAFVVMPDGRARPLRPSAWDGEALHVPPGATIVVPRDPRPYGTLQLTEGIATILGQLAVTAASIAVIAR